jgi:hypothetical protein
MCDERNVNRFLTVEDQKSLWGQILTIDKTADTAKARGGIIIVSKTIYPFWNLSKLSIVKI